MPLQWIKLWIDPCLDGSIRTEFTLEERGLWYELLLIAGKGQGVARDKRPGYLERKMGLPLTTMEIASRLNVPIDKVNACLPKFLKAEMLKQDNFGTYYVVNWSYYQASTNGHKKPSPDVARLRRRAKLHELANEFPADVNKLATPVKINEQGILMNPEVVEDKDTGV